MNKFKQLVLGGLFMLVASNVLAVPVIGTLKMTGGFFALDAGGSNTSDLSQAVRINFDSFGSDVFSVSSADGDYAAAGIVATDTGTITDFDFDPFAGPIADFWTIDIFSFELTDVLIKPSSDPTSFLALDGTGIIRAAGFDDTLASWNFTGNAGLGLFSWSATTTTAPEPGILGLLALGLIGVGLRKKA